MSGPSIAGAALVAALLLTACPPGKAPFALKATFVGPVELETGAEVRYQGVRVGEVDGVSLRQDSPEQPARVELSLRIEDPNVTLREADVFEITSDGMLGEDYVRITAAAEPSEPLASGATVTGLPPFVTRVRESTSEVLDSLAELAKQQRDALLRSISRESELEPKEPAPEMEAEEPAPDAAGPPAHDGVARPPEAETQGSRP